MEYTPLEKDMNIISALDDEPNDVGGLSAAQLKAKFDEGGLAVKDYLNNTLLEELAQKDTDNEETYAKREELQGLVLGQIPDGTITEEKLDDTLKEEIDSAVKASDVFTKEETLSDETAGLLGLPSTAVPDDAFRRIPGVGDVVPPQALRYADEFGVTLLPCAGQILPAEDYPLYAQVQGPITGYYWTELTPTGFPADVGGVICLENGTLLATGGDASSGPAQIYQSTDNGATWTKVRDADGVVSSASLIQKKDGTVVVVCTSNVYTSTDDGATWTVTAKSDNSVVYSQLVEGKDGRLFGTNNSSVMYSDDNGVTWASKGVLSANNSNIAALSDGTIVAASALNASSSSPSKTLLVVSYDNGSTWSTAYSNSARYNDGGSNRVISTLASFGSFALATTRVSVEFVSASPGGNTRILDNTNVIADAQSGQIYNRSNYYIPLDRTTLLCSGRILVFTTGPWIETNRTLQDSRGVKLSDGSAFCWTTSSSDNVFYKSSPSTDIIILPYKPGWFVRVA